MTGMDFSQRCARILRRIGFRSTEQRRRRSQRRIAPEQLEARCLLAAATTATIDNLSLAGSGSTTIDLSNHFDDPETSVVEIGTPIGSFQIATYDRITPNTAQNLVTLASGGNYADMFIHRSDPGFVIQGGGFTFPDGGSTGSVPNNGTIDNEFDNWFDPQLGGLEAGTPLNLRGTVSMAKLGGDPDSATSQWFVSLADNSAILDPQNGGFTVFGRVVGNGMTTVDAIAALQTVNAGGAFGELPVRGTLGDSILRENLVTTTTTVVPDLSYSLTNSNSDLVTASIVDGQLTVTALAGQSGQAELTITATDVDNGTVSQVVEVSVGSPPASQLLTPSSSSDQTPTFTWQTVSDATGYELWVNQIGGQAAIVREQNLTATEFTPTEALPIGDYRAWIRTFNAGGSGPWSDAFAFSIGVDLQQTTITSPAAGASTDVRPEITWTAVTGATEYDVWMNEVGGQAQVIRTTVTGTSLTPDFDLNPGSRYRVWVQAQAGSSEGAWSGGVDFAVQDGLEITSPAAVTQVPRPQFTWTGDQSDVFELWVNSVSGTPTRVIHDTAITGTSFTPTTDLADGDYLAWVRRRPSSGPAGPWSAAYSFVITSAGVPGQAQITDIANAGSGLPVFTWPSIENAARVELWVNGVTTNVARVIHETQLTGLSFTASSALPVGTYRAWIRGISADNVAGAWSAAVDFVVG